MGKEKVESLSLRPRERNKMKVCFFRLFSFHPPSCKFQVGKKKNPSHLWCLPFFKMKLLRVKRCVHYGEDLGELHRKWRKNSRKKLKKKHKPRGWGNRTLVKRTCQAGMQGRKLILMKHHEWIKTAKVLSDVCGDCSSHWLLEKVNMLNFLINRSILRISTRRHSWLASLMQLGIPLINSGW